MPYINAPMNSDTMDEYILRANNFRGEWTGNNTSPIVENISALEDYRAWSCDFCTAPMRSNADFFRVVFDYGGLSVLDEWFFVCGECYNFNATCVGVYCIEENYYRRNSPRVHEITLSEALERNVIFLFRNTDRTLEPMCSYCVAESIFECNECGVAFPFTSQEDIGLCMACSTETPQTIEVDTSIDVYRIHGYSHKPSPIFHKMPWEKKDKDPLYIGVEYEIEPGRLGSPRKILSHFMDTITKYGNLDGEPISNPETVAYGKSDGSLNNGVEIVSHPGTFDWWKSVNNPFIKAVESCKEEELTSASSRCGMHMHINKSAFTSYHLHKFSKFMFSPENRRLIEQVSGRAGGLTSYAHWEDIDNDSLKYIAFASETVDNKYKISKTTNIFSKKRRSPTQQSRSCFVNFQNYSTVEMRLFGGSTDYNDVLAHIDFCHALYVFSRENPLHKMSHVYFTLFLRKNSKTYRHLCNFLKLSVSKKPKDGVKIVNKKERNLVTA